MTLKQGDHVVITAEYSRMHGRIGTIRNVMCYEGVTSGYWVDFKMPYSTMSGVYDDDELTPVKLDRDGYPEPPTAAT